MQQMDILRLSTHSGDFENATFEMHKETRTLTKCWVKSMAFRVFFHHLEARIGDSHHGLTSYDPPNPMDGKPPQTFF